MYCTQQQPTLLFIIPIHCFLLSAHAIPSAIGFSFTTQGFSFFEQTSGPQLQPKFILRWTTALRLLLLSSFFAHPRLCFLPRLLLIILFHHLHHLSITTPAIAVATLTLTLTLASCLSVVRTRGKMTALGSFLFGVWRPRKYVLP